MKMLIWWFYRWRNFWNTVQKFTNRKVLKEFSKYRKCKISKRLSTSQAYIEESAHPNVPQEPGPTLPWRTYGIQINRVKWPCTWKLEPAPHQLHILLHGCILTRCQPRTYSTLNTSQRSWVDPTPEEWNQRNQAAPLPGNAYLIVNKLLHKA